MSDSVNTPDAAYEDHASDWSLAEDLWGGTSAMIEAGKRRAPQFPAESDDSYKCRIGGAVLFNAFKRTIGIITGKAFQHDIEPGDNIPDKIEPYLENIDREGTHLDVFARKTFELGVRDGIRFVYVDMPPNQGVRLDEQRALLLRPYWVDVDPRNLIGWKTIVVGGRRVLSQIRMRETRTRETPGDEFATETIVRVRVVDAAPRDAFGSVIPETFTSFRVYEEIENAKREKSWTLVEDGIMRPLTVIPLAAFIPRPCDFMQGEMVLRDLADLNVAHWRSDSDQRYILHKARVPLGVLAGFNPDDVKNGLVKLGPDNWLVATDPQAKAFFMEHSGAAIGAGAKDLEDLENRMRVLGLRFVVEKQLTATEAASDDASSDSELAKIVRSLVDCLENALTFTAMWEGVAVDDGSEIHGGEVTINTDYGTQAISNEEAKFLLECVKAGTLSKATFLAEVKRRGLMADDFDVKAEVQAIEDELAAAPQFEPIGGNQADPNAVPPANMPGAMQ